MDSKMQDRVETITFAVTAWNEVYELSRLIDKLIKVIGPEDEILIQLDTNATVLVRKLLDYYKTVTEKIRVIEFSLNNNFGQFKNNIF